MSAATEAYVTSMQVRFGDVDAAGIAYFPKIFDFLHQAFEELWDVHVGKRYAELIVHERLGFPLVRSEVEFQRPLRFGDRPEVRITCFHLGHSSLGLRYRVLVDGLQCLEARMTTACVDLDELKSVRMPAEHRARFETIREQA